MLRYQQADAAATAVLIGQVQLRRRSGFSPLFRLRARYISSNPRIVPRFIQWHVFLVRTSGVIEILGGSGLLVSETRRAGAWGLIALLIAVFPANVYMATSPSRDPAGSPSIETGGDAAHDYRASAAERRAVGPGDVSVSREFQNAELLGQ